MTQDINDQLHFHESSELLLKQLRELWEFAEGEMRGQTFQTRNDLRLIILLQITAAANRIIHSVIAQIKGGSFYGLDFLLRPLVEGLINYKYIKEDPTQMRARAFIVDDTRSRLANIRRLIPLLETNTASGMAQVTDANKYRLLENQLVQEQNTLIDQFGEDNLRLHNIEARARESGTMEIYATVYWLLCQDTHLTARGLDRFMSEDNGQLSVSWNQDLNRFNEHIKTFYIIFAALLGQCNEQFGIPNKDGLDKFASIP